VPPPDGRKITKITKSPGNSGLFSLRERVEASRVVELIRECGKHLDVLDDLSLLTALKDLFWIPCRDGHRRRPCDAYFDSPTLKAVRGAAWKVVDRALRRDSAAGAVRQRLGVADRPTDDDVVGRANQLSRAPRNKATLADVRAVLDFLAGREADIEDGDLSTLRDLEWLPAEGHDNWSYVCGAMPSSRANSLIDLSPDRARRIASDRNSGGYGGLVLPIMDSPQGAHAPNHQVSTKLRQLQIVQRKALTPNDFPNLQALTDRLTTFAEHYRTIARPFDWTFTPNDLNQVLAKIADREPDLRLAA
jgi:hypothetical protein